MVSRVLVVLWLVTVPIHGAAQEPYELQFDSAYCAWDAGDYIEAMERLERLLMGGGSEHTVNTVQLSVGGEPVAVIRDRADDGCHGPDAAVPTQHCAHRGSRARHPPGRWCVA